MSAALLIGVLAPATVAGFIVVVGELLDAVERAAAAAFDEDLAIVLGVAW